MKPGNFIKVMDKKKKDGPFVLHETDFDPERYEVVGGEDEEDEGVGSMSASDAAAEIAAAETAEELDAMAASESARKKPRKGVLAAVDARRAELEAN